ncbi:MAG: phospholipase D-like domain-containing protein [Kiritimatiellia bacterium]
MKLIRGIHHQSPIDMLNRDALQECDEVWAAVAYVMDDSSLIKPCHEKRIRFRLWARYDYTVPVNVSILEWFLGKSPLAVCKLVPDIFHPKVIWWRSFGVYIGSANLTRKAWFGNIEAGLFLSQDEIVDEGLTDELETFFAELDEVAHGLTKELVDEIKKHQEDPRFIELERMRKDFEEHRKIPRLDSLVSVQKKSNSGERRRREFLQEWNRTLGYIRDIAITVSQPENRPPWVAPNIPAGVQADQFLHAYYYNRVMEGRNARHREYHENNKKRPHQALEEATRWWRNLQTAPSSEDRTMNEWAPFIARNLSASRIRSIDEETFVEVFTKVHAFRNYADRANYKSLGLSKKLPQMSSEERGVYLAKRLYGEETEKGETFLELLKYLLYGGEQSDLPERLFEISFTASRRIRHAGLSTFGEIVGWALPKEFPPRNGRTSKALYALGYDVTIHTE